tara:strand:+ start:400 stop:2799 length:2400 start_codon:yes stop_codon:yes gene_type:complete
MELLGIAVDSPIGKLQTYTYQNNDLSPFTIGELVWVPFGKNILQGIVVQYETASELKRIKPVLKSSEINYKLSSQQLAIGAWISRHYQTSLFTSLSLFLPPGAKNKISYMYHVNHEKLSNIPGELSSLVNQLSQIHTISEREIQKLLEPFAKNGLQQLINQKLLSRVEKYPAAFKRKYSQTVVLSHSYSEQKTHWAHMDSRCSKAITLLEDSQGISLPQFKKTAGIKTFNQLLSSGTIGISWSRFNNLPEPDQLPISKPHVLNRDQKLAVDIIGQSMNSSDPSHKRYLLHGIPGSGKTEVYMALIQKIIDDGKTAIFLVPEISLATQTLQELDHRFPGQVCTLHSNMTPRQKFEIWTDIQQGHYKIVVGPRSALFSPLSNLGIIVIDEEHEWNYKQQDIEPFYHARTVALQLCLKNNATLLLGSATPSVETFFNASERPFYQLLELPEKAVPRPANPSITNIEVVDMREELLEGNNSIFSRSLLNELDTCLKNKKQAILFLNRRGSASIVSCRECGTKVTCSSCSTVMTYHQDYQTLVCHTCNKKRKFNEICRACKGNQVRTLGNGTKRVVDELQKLFPNISIGRWDGDTPHSFEANETIYNNFKNGQTQILVGTQMIAKGLDVANVRLVGAIHADVGINLPDFRASEQWFTTMYQFIGRTGRDGSDATALIQTFQPDHPILSLLKKYDYFAMYNQEIANRKKFNNPPFTRMAHMVFTHVNNTTCQKNASEAAKHLRELVKRNELKNIEIMGPAPGLPKKARGRYRWHVIVRGSNVQRVLTQYSSKSNCLVDVDPIHVL